MEATRLQLVAKRLLDDFSNTGIADLLTKFQQRAASALPRGPRDDLEFVSIRNRLFEALNKSTVGQLEPSLARIADSIGAHQVTGDELRNRLDRVLNQSSASAAERVVAIQAITNDVHEFLGRLSNLTASLDRVGITPDLLANDTAEVTVMIPQGMMAESITGLCEELRLLDRHLKVVVELSGDPVDSYRLRYLGQGSLEVYVLVLPATAITLAKAIQAAIDIVQRRARLRITKQELMKLEIQTAVVALEAQEKLELDQQIRSRAEAIIADRLRGLDGSRANELTQHLKNLLKFLIKQLARGIRIDIRLQLSPPTDETSGSASDAAGSPASAIGRDMSIVESTNRQLKQLDVSIVVPELLEEGERTDQDGAEEESGQS